MAGASARVLSAPRSSVKFLMLQIAEAGPVPKDAVIAMLGASTAVGGFVLVFWIMLWGFYSERLTKSPKDLQEVEPLGALLQVTAVIVALALASAGLDLLWLALPGGHVLYVLTLWLFGLELLAALYIAYVMWGIGRVGRVSNAHRNQAGRQRSG